MDVYILHIQYIMYVVLCKAATADGLPSFNISNVSYNDDNTDKNGSDDTKDLLKLHFDIQTKHTNTNRSNNR